MESRGGEEKENFAPEENKMVAEENKMADPLSNHNMEGGYVQENLVENNLPK